MNDNKSIHKLADTGNAATLFRGWEDTMIWSCIQGVMGGIYADDDKNPASAMALLGDICFFAGSSDESLVRYKPPELADKKFIIMTPQNEAWAELIERHFGEKAKRTTRYAIKKEQNLFDKKKLEAFVNLLPSGFELKQIDEEIYGVCMKLPWCRDFVSNYESYAKYRDFGLGFVIVKDGEIVAGASSYSSYNGGIEIQIDTDTPYRRWGFATICGAMLILECLGRGLYPSWDAQNKWSVALAEKLGYHFDREYTAYDITDW